VATAWKGVGLALRKRMSASAWAFRDKGNLRVPPGRWRAPAVRG
jgi:hypothetical protein